MYKVNLLPQNIDIGYVGEQRFRPIEIDMTPWMGIMPDGVPSIVHTRPGETDDDAYIVATTFEDNILKWTVSASDLGTEEGAGIAQVWLEEEENNTLNKRGMSAVFATIIHGSVGNQDPVVPPSQLPWLQQMTGLKTATVAAAAGVEGAQEAAEAAQEAAEAAQAAAETSEENSEAWAVGKRGGEDVGSSDPTYHNNSKYYAGQAADSATAAAGSADDAADSAAEAEAIATMVAPVFDAEVANPAGSYVTKDGVLYYLPEGHEEDEAWADTTKEETKVGTQLSGVKSAITNLLVPGGEAVTLTNSVNAQSYYENCNSFSGFNAPTFSDGVMTFVSITSTEKSPYFLASYSFGTKKWISGFKYRITKLDPQLGNPENVRIHLGTTAYDFPVVYNEWISFSKTETLDLTRIRFALRNFATAPSANAIQVEVKEMYLYDATGVDSEVCSLIMEQQSTNYQDGTVTYGDSETSYVPDDSLSISGKVADSKAVGDAIKASGSIINVKYFGVKGNGTDDDTTAIRDLFTSKTGTFYFPAGTYKITGTITLPASSEIVGDGDVSIINMYSCTDLTACTFRGNDKVYPYILITGDNCAVRHIKLTGNNSLQEKRHAGIGVLDADRCCIEDVTISNINYDSSQTGDATVSGYGICVNRSTFVDVVKCDVRTCGYECIGIVDDCNYCTVRDCYTQDGWRTCIQVHRGSCNTLIENNYMKQTHNKYDACFTVHGMTDQKIRNLRVLNNTMECTQNGDQGQNYCAPAQIMSHSDCLVFMGNRIKGGKRAFFIAEDSNNAKIIGNDMNCNDTSDYGVTLASTATIVIGNYLDNEATTKTNNISQNPTLVGNVGIGS